MGVQPAPLCATARMNNIESSSVYTDLRLSARLDLRFFVRFYDDIGAMTTNKRKAELTCSKMEQQDHTGLLKLTLDYPSNHEVFTPYLNTENNMDRKGNRRNTQRFFSSSNKYKGIHNHQYVQQNKYLSV